MHYYMYFFLLGLVVGISSTRVVGILLRERRKKALVRACHQEKTRRVFSSAVPLRFLGWERLRGQSVDHFTNSYLGATDADCYVSDYEPGQLSSQPEGMS